MLDVHQLAVPPMSRVAIRGIAHSMLRTMGVTGPAVNVVRLVEFMSNNGDFDFDVVGVSDLGDMHGLTIPDRGIIYLREDVYAGAVDGNGRDRGTVAHELGHLVLHAGVSGFARRISGNHSLKPYEDPEWQAKCFQGELLVPSIWVDSYRNATQVAELCGVSTDAAATQLRAYKRDGIYRGAV
jgi:Zn-dependent peptidase ImmA (M78 family)